MAALVACGDRGVTRAEPGWHELNDRIRSLNRTTHIYLPEGLEGPADIAMIGNEATLEAGIARLVDAGVTDFNANLMPDGKDREGSMTRTAEFLAELARR